MTIATTIAIVNPSSASCAGRRDDGMRRLREEIEASQRTALTPVTGSTIQSMLFQINDETAVT
jgi:hypothetical protein